MVPEKGTRDPVVHRRVLVVDDNVDGAYSLSLLLKHLGADVRVAHSGDDALHELSSFEATLILLDIVMPWMDGYEVARRIRAAFPHRRTTIAALSAWAFERHRTESKAAGCDYHLVKPAAVDDLKSLLELVDPASIRAHKRDE